MIIKFYLPVQPTSYNFKFYSAKPRVSQNFAKFRKFFWFMQVQFGCLKTKYLVTILFFKENIFVSGRNLFCGLSCFKIEYVLKLE